MFDMRKAVTEHPLMAVLRKVPKEIVVDYADAIANGGIPFFEVALNSTDALQEIELLRNHFGDRALIGAGTALTPQLCQDAISAGAQFILTPGVTETLVSYCAEHEIGMLPGVVTPSEVMLCKNYGYDVQKLFPAGDVPAGYVKSLKGPFDTVDFVAVGGVSPNNLRQFFDQGFIGAALGGKLVSKDLVEARDWNGVTKGIRALCSNLADK